MSKTVDERVVSMQFDNSKFEKNVHTTMSTLDKLKQSLNFKSASKGFENINSAAKNVNMTGLGNAVESVRVKFSALEVMGVTALANITNSAVNAGRRIVSALTIEPVKTGFQEYETQINAVQTILANTQSKGTTLDQVNKALDELNKYADLTIYNFTEMTRNIGTFTAAGVDLDTSVNAIKGIANLAAVSGSTSQQASTAMYQLSQALASGTVKLMDWNSVVNAGMGGQVFQDALKETARVHGIAIDKLIENEGSFRETLSKGWLTSEILTETLQKFTLTTEGLTEEQIKANREMLRAKGYTEEQIDEIFKLGETATNAATKVKTFTQLWDVLKEAAQSGWSQTWKLILGDFEEAKNLFTPLSDFFTNIINKMSDARNSVLESALGKGFTDLSKKITGILEPAKKAVDTVKDTVDAVTNLDDIVSDVIIGKFGNGEDRLNALTEAGQNYYRIQNKVNETLGCSFRYTKEQIESQDKLLGIQNKSVDGTKEESKETSKLTDEKKNLIKKIASMTEEQMRSEGYTEDQIKAFKELGATADKLGIPLDEFIDNMDQINGRWLLLNGFKNIGKGLIKVFKTMKEAWASIFPPKSTEEKAEGLFTLIGAFNKFTSGLIMSDETADNLRRTLRGVFAIIDILTTVIGGGFKLAISAVNTILGYFDLNILQVTAYLGDALVAFRDFVKENNLLVKGLDILAPYLKKAVEAIKEWIEGFEDADNIPKYIIEGLINGLTNGASLAVEAVIELGKKIIQGIKDVLGIHSPSTEFFDIGVNIIEGLINGLKSGVSAVWDFIKNIGTNCLEIISDIDWGGVFASLMAVGILYIAKMFADAFMILASPLEGLGDLLSGLGEMFEGLGANLRASALKKKSKAILNFAIAIGIMAAAVIALAQLETGKLWATIGAIAALSAIIIALSFAASAMEKVGNFGKPSLAILAIAGSLLLVAIAMKQLSNIDIDDVPTVLWTLRAAILGLVVIMLAFKVIADSKGVANMDKAGVMLFKVSAALLVLAVAMKLMSKFNKTDIIKSLAIITALELLFAGIIAVSHFAGEHGDKAGKMLMKMSLAMLVMVAVIKLVSKLNGEEIAKGLTFIGMVSALFSYFIAISYFAGEHGAKAGSMLLMMSGAMLIMVTVIKSASKLKEEEIAKGLTVIAMIGVLFTALIAVSYIAGKNATKAGAMLLMMSGAMLILTGVLFLISKMDPSGLTRALGVVTVLETLFIGLIAVTKLAQDCKTTLILLLVAIGMLTAALVGLSFIDSKKLASATAALTMVITAFGLLVAATGMAKKVNIASMAILLGAVTVLAGIIVVLSAINPQTALATAGALSLLITTLSASLILISNIGSSATKAVGAMALLGLVVGEIAAILGIMAYFDITPSIETSASLSILLLSMAGVCVILSVLGPSVSAAVTGAVALSGVVFILGALVTSIGYLMSLLPESTYNDIQNGLDRFISLFEQIGYGIGSIIGNFVAGLFDGLPLIADQLTLFMEKLQPFFAMLSGVDSSTVEAGKTLAEMLLILTAAELLDQILGWATGSADLTSFGDSILAFGNALVSFSKIPGIDTINSDAVTVAAEAGKKMAEMANVVPKTGGIWQDIMGAPDIEEFGKSIVEFGKSMVKFSTIEGIDSINSEALAAAAEGGKQMASMADTVPKTGGIWQGLMGAPDIVSFGESIEAFGQSMVNLSTIENIDKINPDRITAIASAGKALAELANEIPSSGGLFQVFGGDKDMSEFGGQIYQFAIAMKDFSIKINEGAGVDTEKVDEVVKAAKSLNKLVGDGNIFDSMSSIDVGSIENFGTGMASLGTAIKKFSNATSGGIDTESVTKACSAGKSIFDLVKNTPSNGGLLSYVKGSSDLSSLGTQIVSFGKSMKTFSAEISGIDSNSMISHTNGFKTVVNTLKDIGIKSVEGFNQSFAKGSPKIAQSINNMLQRGAKEITNKNDSFNKAGKILVDNLAKGMLSKKDTVKNSISSLVSGSLSNVKTQTNYDEFYDAGEYLVKGFANGISENDYRAEAKAAAMARAAKEAAEEALGIASPSKVFYKIGSFTGQGFVNALSDYSSRAYNASSNMADYAKDGFNHAINNILAMLDTDMDMQPTIRPVLDLSDVESGAVALNGMFGNGLSIGMTSNNIKAISSMMNNRSQNGGNDDVVSAINKLGKSMSNTGNTTYNVNGVTYDDGSNVSDAVKALIRAAKVERRA